MPSQTQNLYQLMDNTAPKGFRMDADGNLMREDRIKQMDLERDQVTKDLFRYALEVSDRLEGLYWVLQDEVARFVDHAIAQYGKSLGGKKGNVTLFSYDRRIKIERSRQDKLTFNQNLLAAKAMIDDCIKRWSKGSNRNLQTIVQGAFKTDKNGRFSAAKVLGLRKHNIDDDMWKQAMQALADAIETDSTAEYFRIYWRDENGSYHQLPLDLANINNLPPSDKDTQAQ